MRQAARVDANQIRIVAALRTVGCSVQLLHQVGKGCPDLLVGRNGINVLLEVKDGSKPESRRRLTPDEQIWHDAWRGQINVVSSIEQALRIIGDGGRGR